MSKKLQNNKFQLSKVVFGVFVFFTCSHLTAQEQTIHEDPSKDSIFNEYIIDYKKRFNVKLEVSNDIKTYGIVYDDINLDIKPN